MAEIARIKARKYYEANRDMILEKNRGSERLKAYARNYNSGYYARNKAEIREQHRGYHQHHRYEHKVRSRNWAEKNAEALVAYRRLYYLENRDHITETHRLWVEENREAVRESGARRRARKRGASGHHTAQEWRAVCDRQGHLCAHCLQPRKLERDHILPISRGGSDDISNIQGLCRSCNARKGAKIEPATIAA